MRQELGFRPRRIGVIGSVRRRVACLCHVGGFWRLGSGECTGSGDGRNQYGSQPSFERPRYADRGQERGCKAEPSMLPSAAKATLRSA